MTVATKRIPMADCYFCESCQCFVDSAVQCECGSEALMCMSAVMNRQEVEETVEVPA